MTTTPTTQRIRSADGTMIAFQVTGDGPPLVLVEAAGHFRAFSSFDGLVPLLAREFAVVTYDRRGRGESSDTAPYAPEREVEDLAVLVEKAGGSASLYGFSSGALLALRAAAAGVPVDRLALLEPPLREGSDTTKSDLTAELEELIGAGRGADAVEAFNKGIGVPEEIIAESKPSEAWSLMVSCAHTLVYDCTLSDTTTSDILRAVEAPTLVLDSEGSTDNLTGWATTVAARLPRGTHRSLPGEWHGVADDVLAPVLVGFLGQPG